MEIRKAQLRAVLEDNPPLQFVGKLANVAGPGVGKKFTSTLRRDGLAWQAMALTKPFRQQFGQFQNVFSALPQRGDFDAVEVQPMIEIFAELPGSDELFQIPM